MLCAVNASLYEFQDCLEKTGSVTLAKMCTACLKNKENNVLLKEIVSGQGSKKFYPNCIYPFCSLISTLEILIRQPEFLLERWRQQLNGSHGDITDIYNGTVWKEFTSYEGTDSEIEIH